MDWTRDIIGSVNHVGKGESRRVFSLRRSEGHVCNLLFVNSLHRGLGAAAILKGQHGVQ